MNKFFILHFKLKTQLTFGLIAFMRRLRDSNPRYPLEVYTLSRRAPSTTRTSLLWGGKNTIHKLTETIFLH